jgi:hypothetical protein
MLKKRARMRTPGEMNMNKKADIILPHSILQDETSVLKAGARLTYL